MTRERYGYFHHRDKVSACTAMPQRHPCHAEQSEASRMFRLLQSRDSATVPQDDIATRCLKGEEVNTVERNKREQLMI
jgi:hypothetical protein